MFDLRSKIAKENLKCDFGLWNAAAMGASCSSILNSYFAPKGK